MGGSYSAGVEDIWAAVLIRGEDIWVKFWPGVGAIWVAVSARGEDIWVAVLARGAMFFG